MYIISKQMLVWIQPPRCAASAILVLIIPDVIRFVSFSSLFQGFNNEWEGKIRTCSILTTVLNHLSLNKRKAKIIINYVKINLNNYVKNCPQYSFKWFYVPLIKNTISSGWQSSKQGEPDRETERREKWGKLFSRDLSVGHWVLKEGKPFHICVEFNNKGQLHCNV